MQSEVFIEAIIVGILSVIVGTLVIYTLFSSGKMLELKKTYPMQLPLFFTGFFMHLICEVTGVNKLYCKKGSACK